jgi:dUTP pyrophosphatase
MKVNMVNRSSHPLPEYQTEGAAGMDLRAELMEALTLKPMERRLIPTGLFIELPQGLEAQIRPRSGLAYKAGITVLNSPGTIDSDYRGELKVLLINLSQEAFTIQNGERIAQLVIAPYVQATWEEVAELTTSVRQESGFGSTGKN